MNDGNSLVYGKYWIHWIIYNLNISLTVHILFIIYNISSIVHKSERQGQGQGRRHRAGGFGGDFILVAPPGSMEGKNPKRIYMGKNPSKAAKKMSEFPVKSVRLWKQNFLI